MPDHAIGALRDEEVTQLDRARLFGGVSAQIYDRGVFSEPEFVIYGVLQRLAIQGHLTYVGLRVDGLSAAYDFLPTQTDEQAFRAMDDRRLIAA